MIESDNSSNPYEEALETATVQAEVMSPSALEAINRAEVDIAIATAKRYPRDLSKAIHKCRELATLNAEVAASCYYTIPRAGKRITGPSVHFARMVVTSYGNINALARVVSADQIAARCQGICHDMENNVRFGIEIEWDVQPPHEPSPARWRDQVKLAKDAGSAVAYRRAVFNAIPFALFEPVYKQARLVAAGKGKTFEDRRKNALEAFEELKVPEKDICRFLGRAGVEAITTEDLIDLFGILTAIQDKQTTVEEAFSIKAEEPKAKTVKAEVPKPKVVIEERSFPGPTKPSVTPVEDFLPSIPSKKVETEPRTIEEDFLADLPPTRKLEAKTPEPKTPPPEPKPSIPETKKVPYETKPPDAIYAKVEKKMLETQVTAEQLLDALRAFGVIGSGTKEFRDIPVGALRMADADWPGVLDQINAPAK